MRRWSSELQRIELAEMRAGSRSRPLTNSPLRSSNSQGSPLLVDCLSFWLSNRLLAGADLHAEIEVVVDALHSRNAVTVAVSSEVGLGIVPENALARNFRDASGDLHQAVARIAGSVTLMIAGCPLQLKKP